MNKITTVTKAVIAVLSTLGALLAAKVPTGYAGWLQDAASALGAGLLVWYVPNTANGVVLPVQKVTEPTEPPASPPTQAAMGTQIPG